VVKSKRDKQSHTQGKAREPQSQITPREVEGVEDRSSPRTPVIFEVVCRLGEEEMARPVFSLWWSGIAAGFSISFSLLAQAILYTHLPDAPWRALVADLGLYGRHRYGDHVAAAAFHREHDHGRLASQRPQPAQDSRL
jgi:hypothetical protein